MKKIAHFIDSDDPGGAETLVIEICKNLNSHGFQPEVYHFGNTWLQKQCNQYKIPSVIIPGYKLYKSYKTIPFFTILFLRFIKSRNIELLHSHLFDSITGACFAAFLSKTPHIGTLHDIYTIEEKRQKILLIQLASILNTRLVTVSESMKECFLSLGRFRHRAFQVIFNGVNLKEYNRPINEGLRLKLKLDLNSFVFICVGRLVDIKGHDTLIDAFSRLTSEYSLKLLIVGDGPKRNYFENVIEQNKLKDNIKLLGHREDIPDLLKLSDCFVLSSHSEGLSCSILEAMAAGLPIIATDVGGNYELVKNGVTGYLIPPNRPLAFSERMQSMVENVGKRKEFGYMSLKLASEKFSLEAMIEEYVRNYHEMINEPR